MSVELTEAQKAELLEAGVDRQVLSAVRTLELAAYMHPDSKNKAVRKCLRVIAPRLHPLARASLVHNVDQTLAYTGLIAYKNYLRRWVGQELEDCL